MISLDELNDNRPPFAKLLDFRFVFAELERVVAELLIREELCNRRGIAHGGVIMAFADTLGATGTILNLPDGMRTTTIESKTNFLGGSPAGTLLIGESTPLHRGKTTMVWQTRISTDEGRLMAMITQTQFVFPAKT
jgi:uncharacterized protein (TIGR00369 family)